MSETRPRPRSDSREREAGRPTGRDTNSNDQHSLRCRVFIGNLSTDKTSKAEIEELFEKYGSIVSCSLHNNFGFVQFHNDKDADLAVEEMHGKTLFGKRVDVNLAGLRRKPQSKDQFEVAPPKEDVVPPEMIKAGRAPRGRDRSPLRSERELPYGRSGAGYNSSYDSYSRPRSGEYPGERRMDTYGAYDRRDPVSYDHRDTAYRHHMEDSRLLRQPLRPAIDCEIVSLSAEESRYAEEVEGRLRSIGLVCNIGYPPADLPILELMERISRTGTLYAVVVTAQNSQHRSCTLNILHGTRQEHRNMPLNDALSFVARNFDAYLRSMRDPMGMAAPTPYMQPRNPYPHVPPNPTPVTQNPVTSIPEKQMSTEEIEAMIAKLKREKEEREAAAAATSAPKQNPADQGGEVNNKIGDEQQPVASNSYSYNSYPPPPQAQNNGSTPTIPSSEGYYQQPQQYEQQPLYR